MRRTAFALMAVFAIVAGLFTGTPAAHAATSCLPQFPVAPAHKPTSLSPTGLATTASTAIGQIGKRPPAAGQPSWNGDDRVNALAQIGNTVYAAGEFDAYIWNGKSYPRHNVVAFDATTGKPTAFAPNVDGEVLTIAPSCTGTLLFLGGSFHHVNNKLRNYAAKVQISDSSLAAWDPEPNNVVEGISIVRGHLIVAGRFTTISGVSRTNWASLNQTAASAKADSWLNIPISGSDPAGPQKVLKVVPNHHGTYAVAIGNFNTVGGKAHRRIVVLKLTDSKATVMPWATPLTASNGNSNGGTDCSAGYSDPERDVTWEPGDTRFVTAATGGAHAGSICDAMTKWDGTAKALTNTNARPMAVQRTGGDTLTAVACSSVSCIATGHNRWADNPPIYYKKLVNNSHYKWVTPCSPVSPMNTKKGRAGYNCQNPPSMGGASVERPGIIEGNMTNMKATPWNPGRSKQHAMHNTEMLTPQGLWIGSDGDKFAGVAHNDLVLVPFATGLK